MLDTDEAGELRAAVARVLESKSRKKLIVAGPGAGKTTLFRELLAQASGGHDERLVLTFINNLKDDLDRSLGETASVYTLHGYCQLLLRRHAELRDGMTADFICHPGLAGIIKRDWQWLNEEAAPQFVERMRSLACTEAEEQFYLTRSAYYDALDFDDSVYRVTRRLNDQPHLIPAYELVLIDEFQDFNSMESEIINLLSRVSPIVIAGDDDQALYSQLRGASWDHIRARHAGGEYEVFELPFCMRCPEVIVGAINDVIAHAIAAAKLTGRIPKPFRTARMSSRKRAALSDGPRFLVSQAKVPLSPEVSPAFPARASLPFPHERSRQSPGLPRCAHSPTAGPPSNIEEMAHMKRAAPAGRPFDRDGSA